ncbi:MAG: ATPase, partial [Litoreibacter sp.]|nr:ATPase [Litoreibacter sp.]
TIDIMADIKNIDAPALPLAEMTSFGFEILIRKAMSKGLAEAFRHSSAYQAYAAERAQDAAL